MHSVFQFVTTAKNDGIDVTILNVGLTVPKRLMGCLRRGDVNVILSILKFQRAKHLIILLKLCGSNVLRTRGIQGDIMVTGTS